MEIFRTAEAMRAATATWRARGRRIGFVPTMGALHEGHLSLIDLSRERADVTVVSIFVNPTQFGPSEDFNKYPRDEAADTALCEARGADAVFLPPVEAIYPPGASTFVVEESVSKEMEGASRPGHFRGVCTVVTILFNLVQPDVAIFGEKDAQQLAVIERMTRDLALPVEIVPGPTVREEDGLALSSRNRYLGPRQRSEAAGIHAALRAGKALVEQGVTQVERVEAEVTHRLTRGNRIRVIYARIVQRETFAPAREIRPGHCRLCVAVWLDEVRLIDNITL